MKPQMVKVIPSSGETTWVKSEGLRFCVPSDGISIPLAFAKELVKRPDVEYEQPTFVAKVLLDKEDKEALADCPPRVHAVITDERKDVKCHVCGKEYKDDYWLQKHLEAKHPDAKTLADRDEVERKIDEHSKK